MTETSGGKNVASAPPNTDTGSDRAGAIAQHVLDSRSAVEPTAPEAPEEPPAEEEKGDAPEPRGLRGLVRAVDHASWRHTYALGEIPDGEVVGELGALRPTRTPERLALWVTPEGRFTTERGDATLQRPGLRRILRWAFAPIAWRGTAPWTTRLAMAARRLARVARRPWRHYRAAAERGRRPVGYLHRKAGPGTRPLLSAIHPITGDQLLTTVKREAETFGYGKPTLLGHLVAAAPVTGTLGTRAKLIPWASRFGLAGKLPRVIDVGAIQHPPPSEPVPRDAFRLGGWALLERQGVARVEITVNGRLLGPARLGTPSAAPHDPLYGAEPEVAGFQYLIGPSDIPAKAEWLSIEAVVTGVQGRKFVVAMPEPYPLATEERRDDSDETDEAALRARTRRFLPTRSGRRAGEGLHVLAFTHSLGLGGAQRYVYEQLRRLNQADDFSCAVVAFADGPWREKLEQAGIEVHVSLPYIQGGTAQYEGKLTELGAWASQRNFNLVFASTLDAFIGVDLAHRIGVPSVWTIHESFELEMWWALQQRGERNSYLRTRSEEALANVSALLFPAAATKTLFEPHASAERMITTPLGLELQEIDHFRSRHERAADRKRVEIDPNAKVILCLGIVEPRKNQALLSRAFVEVSQDHPEAQLLLVGGVNTGYARGVRRYLKQTADERSRVRAASSNPYLWHSVADLFVLPSDIESSPIVLLEAMAFETPVLGSRVFGVPELITDGKDGYLFEPNDVGELAGALDRALKTSADERQRIGRAGAQRVRDRHDPDRYADNLDRLFRQLHSDPEMTPEWPLPVDG